MKLILCGRTVLITDGKPMKVSADTAYFAFKRNDPTCGQCANKSHCADLVSGRKPRKEHP